MSQKIFVDYIVHIKEPNIHMKFSDLSTAREYCNYMKKSNYSCEITGIQLK